MSLGGVGDAPIPPGPRTRRSVECAFWQNSRVTSTPDISCSARNANILERRLAVGFVVAMTLKAD